MGHGSTPAAMRSVIGQEPAPQCAIGRRLQRGIEARADREPALGRGLGPEALDHLPADLLAEPLAPSHQFCPTEGRGQDRLRLGRTRLLGRHGTVIGHAVDHPIPPGLGGVREFERVVVVRRLRERGQERGLRQGQVFESLVEIGLRRRRHAVCLQPEVDLIQVEFEHVLLAHGLIDPDGEDQLLHLAGDTDFVAQQHVLSNLLRDGGRADRAAAATILHQVHPPGAGDRERIDSTVAPEFLVLSRQERLLHHVRYGRNRHEDAPFRRQLGHKAAIPGIHPAHDARLIMRQAIERRQVLGIPIICVPGERPAQQPAHQAHEYDEPDHHPQHAEPRPGPRWLGRGCLGRVGVLWCRFGHAACLRLVTSARHLSRIGREECLDRPVNRRSDPLAMLRFAQGSLIGGVRHEAHLHQHARDIRGTEHHETSMT